jgi:outer membrane murein-binding lipoprotein Lpp
VTQATAEVNHLSDNVRQLTDSIESKAREVKELRQDSQAAKVSAARAEGELAAAKRQLDQLILDRQAVEARLSAHSMPADTSAMPATQPSVSATAQTASATTQPAPSAVAATRPSATSQSAK